MEMYHFPADESVPVRRASRDDTLEDSDGSYDDNITVKVPPLQPPPQLRPPGAPYASNNGRDRDSGNRDPAGKLPVSQHQHNSQSQHLHQHHQHRNHPHAHTDDYERQPRQSQPYGNDCENNFNVKCMMFTRSKKSFNLFVSS